MDVFLLGHGVFVKEEFSQSLMWKCLSFLFIFMFRHHNRLHKNNLNKTLRHMVYSFLKNVYYACYTPYPSATTSSQGNGALI